MAQITASAVKSLREKTDLPMMECKKALVEADGDEQKAIAILKESFKKVSLKRQDNPTEEGRIFLKVRDDGSEAAMVEIQCESAPVGGGEHLGEFGEQLVLQLLENPGTSAPEELLKQSPSGGGDSFQTQYENLVATIREKIVVNRVVHVTGPVAGYVHHDNKTAVLFQASGSSDIDSVLRDVAMHIAALRPAVVKPEDLDASLVQAERGRLSEEARATGKPDNIIEKIVDGRMKAFYVEQGVLVLQPFAKDDSKTVSQALAEKGFEAAAFIRWVIGN